MNKLMAAIVCCFLVSGCDSFDSVGDVVLYNEHGSINTSHVLKSGGYCWVSWYHGVEKILLHADGTADDFEFHYTWTLNTPGPRNLLADQRWFAKHCLDWEVMPLKALPRRSELR